MGADLAASLGVRLPSPVEVVEVETLSDLGIRLVLKRDDVIHPDIPGNKWRKLTPNIEAALAGVIRGEEHRPLNPTLDFATKHGMHLVYMSCCHPPARGRSHRTPAEAE